MPHAERARGQRRSPRVNAPVRRRQAAGSLPDVLMALAFAGWTMALIFVIASFVAADITAGEAGPGLARIFAAALAGASLVVFLLAIAVLRESNFIGLRIGYAAGIGAIIGILESALFLSLAGVWMVLPGALLILMIRPVREWLLQGLGVMPQGDGRS